MIYATESQRTQRKTDSVPFLTELTELRELNILKNHVTNNFSNAV